MRFFKITNLSHSNFENAGTLVKLKGLRQRLQRASKGLSITKSLGYTFLSGAELFLFVLRVTDSIRAVWTRRLSAAKIVSERYLFLKCGYGLKYIRQNCVNKNVEKIYK